MSDNQEEEEEKVEVPRRVIPVLPQIPALGSAFAPVWTPRTATPESAGGAGEAGAGAGAGAGGPTTGRPARPARAASAASAPGSAGEAAAAPTLTPTLSQKLAPMPAPVGPTGAAAPRPMRQAAATLLGTADAIDALLDQAMDARAMLAANFRHTERNIEQYDHAIMYNKLSKLPKSKLGMFEQLTATRRELAETREAAARDVAVRNAEIKQLRIDLHSFVTLSEELERQLAASRDETRAEKKRADRLAEERDAARADAAAKAAEVARLEKALAAEVEAGRRRLEQEREEGRKRLEQEREEGRKRLEQEREEGRKRLEQEREEGRKRLEQARAAHEAEKQALLKRQGELELQVDEMRGQMEKSKLEVLELELGLPVDAVMAGHHYVEHPHVQPIWNWQ
jgi:hypothetical protein